MYQRLQSDQIIKQTVTNTFLSPQENELNKRFLTILMVTEN